MERNPLDLGEVGGVVAGNFGEVSEDTHALIAALATFLDFCDQCLQYMNFLGTPQLRRRVYVFFLFFENENGNIFGCKFQFWISSALICKNKNKYVKLENALGESAWNILHLDQDLPAV